MKWLVVLCLLASPAAATTGWSTWTITTRTGQAVALDVTRTPTGYSARFHERQTFWESAWIGYGCPRSADADQAAGEVLLELDRQSDGTFNVKMYKARMYNVGPDGPGSMETTRCVFDSPYTFTGRIVNRAGAAALDHAQVDRYPADHDSFLALHYTSPPCPVPDTAKRTCAGGQWPFHPIIDMPMVDSDGDGISDEWEVGGIHEGVSWLNLKAMGANPDHKDLFMQVDSTEETGLPDSVLADVRSYFASLPISNPDGHNGVTMHIDAGPETPMNGSERWQGLSKAVQNARISDVFTTGTCERPDRGPLTTLQATLDPLRAKVFRYVVVAKYFLEIPIPPSEQRPGGPTVRHPCAGMNWNIPSKAFAIANWVDGAPAPESTQKGVLLHELGHSLGLFHAGDAAQPNFKPNYQSVMNYGYQEQGIPQASAPDDPGLYIYSHVAPSAASEIDERLLADDTGFPAVGLPRSLFVFTCSADGDAALHHVRPRVGVDLRCDGNEHSPAGNDVTWSDGNNPTTLSTFDDVAHLHLPVEDGPSAVAAGRGYTVESRDLAKSMADYGTRIGDRQVPTVKATIRKKGKKRQLTLKAHDDKGLSSAVVSVGGKHRVITFPLKKSKLAKDATQTLDLDEEGDVTVIVTDVANKHSETAVAK